jgi:hypothetical protein
MAERNLHVTEQTITKPFARVAEMASRRGVR